MTHETIHLDDIGFTVVSEPSEFSCDFKAYQIDCPELPGQSRAWRRAGATCTPDCVDSLESAEVYLHGSIKWDGCSNWLFDEQERVMLHFCDKKEAENIGRLMSAMYEIAARLIPHWDQ